MAAEEDKALVRRFIEVGWSKGDMDVIGASVTANYRRHQPGLPINVATSDDLKQVVQMYRTGLPDFDVAIDIIAAGEGLVVTRLTVRGTHTGELAGIPPTGKHVEFTATDIFRMEAGRIAESWHNVDDLGCLQQLGVIPAAA
jgi:steroid delta-isomerase-like uncharacterized protein